MTPTLSMPATRCALLAVLVGSGCAGQLPPIPRLPTDQTHDWRVPAREWSALYEELGRCQRSLSLLGAAYKAQQQAYTAYNTMTVLTGIAGSSTAISGALQVAGDDNAAVNKALGVAGAVLAAGGPILFSILSNQRNPTDLRGNFDKMSAAYGAALRTRSAILYCQTLVARTPEVVQAPSSSYTAEGLADRARFSEVCASFYTAPTNPDAAPAVAAAQEPSPKGEERGAEQDEARRRRARRIIDPEYQALKLVEQLRLQCAESGVTTTTLAAPVTAQPAAAKP